MIYTLYQFMEWDFKSHLWKQDAHIPVLRKHDIKFKLIKQYVVEFLNYKIIFPFSHDAFIEKALYVV